MMGYKLYLTEKSRHLPDRLIKTHFLFFEVGEALKLVNHTKAILNISMS